MTQNGDTPHGYGCRVGPDKSIYQGYHKLGLSTGFGLQIFSSPCPSNPPCPAPHIGFYEGYFDQDRPHGYGREEKDNGEIHEGLNHNGLKEGLGKYTYGNQDMYEGDFWDDFEDGYGCIKFQNGDLYQGKWEKGHRHGFGVLTYKNGKRVAQVYDKGVLKEEGAVATKPK